jgi:hypothetical protein
MFQYMHLTYRSSFHIWEKTCDLWFSEVGLLCLTGSFPVLFACKQHNFIFLYGWIKLHCVYKPHFLIHSSVVGHLGCFQSLAIVNSVAIQFWHIARLAPTFLSCYWTFLIVKLFINTVHIADKEYAILNLERSYYELFFKLDQGYIIQKPS